MFDLPKTYTQGMEEIVAWSNQMNEEMSRRFMLDLYKIYMEWKYVIETSPVQEEDNNG